jgi:hypothetical protein
MQAVFQRVDKEEGDITRQSEGEEESNSDGKDKTSETHSALQPNTTRTSRPQLVDTSNIRTRPPLDPSWTNGPLPYQSNAPVMEESTPQDESSGPWLGVENGSQDELSPGDRLRIQYFGALPPYAIFLPQVISNTSQQHQQFAGVGLGNEGDLFGMDSLPNDFNVVDILNVDQCNNGGTEIGEDFQW